MTHLTQASVVSDRFPTNPFPFEVDFSRLSPRTYHIHGLPVTQQALTGPYQMCPATGILPEPKYDISVGNGSNLPQYHGQPADYISWVPHSPAPLAAMDMTPILNIGSDSCRDDRPQHASLEVPHSSQLNSTTPGPVESGSTVNRNSMISFRSTNGGKASRGPISQSGPSGAALSAADMMQLPPVPGTLTGPEQAETRRFHCRWNGCGARIERTRAALALHLREVHPSGVSNEDARVRCLWNGCTRECMLICNLRRHVFEVHARGVARKIKCERCGQEFTRRGSLRRHRLASCGHDDLGI
ncbi:uncharacterized protein B0H18DRAFT_1047753 [Fomitopsis serialis]|uniref:uncharacterized protein n=1 Tax=Fomitopsis serialis TaxID=139415 RepID=UPI00200783DA|nr:uncharacterized protein B0H18DRAFT_1047753 [Neoantrodia serialis]KAH9913716.1 hypothetical protein B0H18DRAFT_1047753 [Neoantrodia serialis]